MFKKESNFKKTLISWKTENKLKSEQGWKGSGELNDPVIIENINNLNRIIEFRSNKLHYIITGVTINELFLATTQNIIIENCNIFSLNIQGCYNLTIKDNKIISLKTAFTKASAFKNNQIHPHSLIQWESESFQNLLINSARIMIITIPICAFFLLISVFFTSFLLIWATRIFCPFIMTIAFYLLFLFVKRKNYTKNMGSNVKVNNKTLKIR